MTRAALVLLAALASGAAWLDPHAVAREASRLYAAGKFADATAKYQQALVDDPDSALLHFNLGNAAFRDGQFDDAARAFAAVPQSDAAPERSARAAYNLGNAKYRQGATAETSNPQQALSSWAEALVAYRRALGADPGDEDAKFNYELVTKRIADLQKKLEEEKKKQEQQQQNQQEQKQQQQNQQQNQQQQNQQQQDQQQQDQTQQQQDQAQQQQNQNQQQDQAQQQGQPKQDRDGGERQDAGGQKPDGQQQNAPEQAGQPQKNDQQAGESPSPDAQDASNRQQAGAGTAAPGEPPSEMTSREAQALLDAQRDQEVRPDEIVRQLQGADVAEPREDW